MLRPLKVVSQRSDIVAAVKGGLRVLGEGKYIVVTGSKGVGKTVAISTATHCMMGIVHVDIAPGALAKEVQTDVFSQIARCSSRTINPEGSTRRVLMFYRWMTFGHRPVVVLHVAERPPGKPYAELTGVVRGFAAMGLRVIVDASPNSVPHDLLSSRRQNIIEVEEMSDKLIRSEFSELFDAVQRVGLEHVVMAIVGGVPATASLLSDLLKSASNDTEINAIVQKFVSEEMAPAITEYQDRVRACPKMQELLSGFNFSTEVSYNRLSECGVEMTSPDKMLRKVFSASNKLVLVPASPAMRLVLRHGLVDRPTLDELRHLIAK